MNAPIEFHGITAAELDAMVFPRVQAVDTSGLTWQRCVELEPRLTALEQKVRATVPSEDGLLWSSQWVDIKRAFLPLVGWEAPATTSAVLRTDRAYDIVYDHLLDIFERAA